MQDASGPVRPLSSEKCDHHAQSHLRNRRGRLARRLSRWREEQLARKALALAGTPTLVLDLPCGGGRYWPLLAEHPGRVIIGADDSVAVLDVARAAHPPSLADRVRTLQTSSFDICLPDRSVDCIFSMRLAHPVGDTAQRLAMLREFHRVARDTVILSLPVDGNYKAWKHRRLERKRAQGGENGLRRCAALSAHVIEQEYRASGFQILGHFDFLPLYATGRVYVLRRGGA